MYGEYDIGDLNLDRDDFLIAVEKDDNFYVYRRLCKEEVSLKRIAGSGKIVLNPVEPVNIPKNITNFLEIELKDKIIIEPKSKITIYVTFPIEIGTFILNREFAILDVFTLTDPKYTLYGTPSKGVICRYWMSDVYGKVPKTDVLKEGVLELELLNSSEDWVEFGKVVLDVYGMKIYYDDTRVISKASVNITSRGIAETQFVDGKYKMKKAIEVYTAKRLHVLRRSFVMEWGL